MAWELQPTGAVIIKTWCDIGWQTVIDGATGAPVDIAPEARHHRSSTWAGFHISVAGFAKAEGILRDMDIQGVDE